MTGLLCCLENYFGVTSTNNCGALNLRNGVVGFGAKRFVEAASKWTGGRAQSTSLIKVRRFER